MPSSILGFMKIQEGVIYIFNFQRKAYYLYLICTIKFNFNGCLMYVEMRRSIPVPLKTSQHTIMQDVRKDLAFVLMCKNFYQSWLNQKNPNQRSTVFLLLSTLTILKCSLHNFENKSTLRKR